MHWELCWPLNGGTMGENFPGKKGFWFQPGKKVSPPAIRTFNFLSGRDSTLCGGAKLH